MYRTNKILYRTIGISIFLIFLMVGCSSTEIQNEAQSTTADPQTSSEEHDEYAEHDEDAEHDGEEEVLTLPDLAAVDLNGRKLKVIATTSIIGDVVSQVGREAIELITLIAPGQDSHSYEPTPQDLRAVVEADLIFLNGWDLEEGLAHDLEEIGEGVPIVAISAGIEPLEVGEAAQEDEHETEEHQEDEHSEHDDEHQHSGADPHVWFSISNVEQWVENVTAVLSSLDPANADIYQENAAAYSAELADLAAYVDEKIAQIPEENRLLVTNHDAFSYFARDYHFELVGTVIPGASTISEPSAGELAELVETMADHELCTIFTETSVSDTLAQTVAAELNNCETVIVMSLYTESVGVPGSEADSYIGLYKANVDSIVAGLK